MKNHGNGYESTAIETKGLWYAYVSFDGTCVYQGQIGYRDRRQAINEAENFVSMEEDISIEHGVERVK